MAVSCSRRLLALTTALVGDRLGDWIEGFAVALAVVRVGDGAGRDGAGAIDATFLGTIPVTEFFNVVTAPLAAARAAARAGDGCRFEKLPCCDGEILVVGVAGFDISNAGASDVKAVGDLFVGDAALVEVGIEPGSAAWGVLRLTSSSYRVSSTSPT